MRERALTRCRWPLSDIGIDFESRHSIERHSRINYEFMVSRSGHCFAFERIWNAVVPRWGLSECNNELICNAHYALLIHNSNIYSFWSDRMFAPRQFYSSSERTTVKCIFVLIHTFSIDDFVQLKCRRLILIPAHARQHCLSLLL